MEYSLAATVKKGLSTNSCDKAKRRRQCQTAPKVLNLVEPRDAQFVMASLVSSGTTRGEPHFVPRSASIASEHAGKVTAIGWAGSKSPSTSCQSKRCPRRSAPARQADVRPQGPRRGDGDEA